MSLQATNGNFKLIDFGSMRDMRDMCDMGHNKLKTTEVFCTYPFCPPEALAYDCPMPLSMTGAAAIDAYSLGATIYYTIYGTYLYDCRRYSSKADARKLFAKGKIVVPTECPENVPVDIFAIMVALLRPDPTARLSIPALYTYLSENGMDSMASMASMESEDGYEPGEILMVEQLSPPISMSMSMSIAQCAEGNFEMLKEACAGSIGVFPVAASIMDRYSKSQSRQSRQLASEYLIEAVHILAQNTFKPDWYPTTAEQTRTAIMDILYQLDFEI